MRETTNTFYKYLSLHSLLIGIFPFFIPVYLWNKGFGLADICIFIGVSGFAFCISLWVWDHVRQRLSLINLIGISLLLELMLLGAASLIDEGVIALLGLGVCYGAYNCFFWTTQRALFFEGVDASNSGRRYGNMQIYVGLVLQVGILIGGLLLEKLGFSYVITISALVCLVGFTFLSRNNSGTPTTLNQVEPLSLAEIFKFKDTHASKFIFLIDGPYLFLESFFWIISLFLIAHESFVTLGLMVMSLAVIFGIIFYLLKNMIDRLNRWRIYHIAVVLYALSWVMRANVNEQLPLVILFIALVLITFCTSFFRLVMNKRFYDLARDTVNHRYLVLKSYYSQVAIGITFVGLGLLLKEDANIEKVLTISYWVAAALSFGFILYGAAYAKAGRIPRIPTN